MDEFAPLVKARDDTLTNLSTNVERLRGKLAERTALENALELLGKEITELEIERIPDLMFEAGLQKFVTTDGAMIEVKQVVTATWPKETEKAEAAIRWLEETHNEGVLKVQVSADYGKANRDKAIALFNQLRGDNQVKVTLTENVHANTLNKLMRDCLRIGTQIYDGLGLFTRNKAVLKEPKNV